MKTSGKLQFVSIIAVIAVLGLTFSSFSAKDNYNPMSSTIVNNEIDVNITVDSKTTQDEFEDIMDMLKEHDIKASFTNIKRNDDGEIISIKIELEDLNTGSKTLSSSQSNLPIDEISFGRRDGSLYITQGESHMGSFAFFGNHMPKHSFNMDSIFGHRFHMLDSLHGNKFSFNFDDEDGNILLFNGRSFNMDNMMEDMQDMLKIEEDENGDKRIIIKKGKGKGMNFFFNDDDSMSWHSDDSGHKTQKFKFYDDPNTEKLIIIDGKESTFEKLDALAKDDKLDTVDVLKGKTAVSIYGEKAKDGAIIAITLQKQ
ncbi:MAG: hypothetical protein EX263_14110 [Flavobacteriaceae bacterium]|nr:MAG: hypothetical protein EX263_14110 [Flavobacteriaceae bacterium]